MPDAPLHLTSSQLPDFTRGHHIVQHLGSLVEEGQLLGGVVHGSEGLRDFFKTVFPEVYIQHGVGEVTKESYKIWDEKENVITIKPDNEPTNEDDKKWDVYVGGPAAIFGAVLQSQSDESDNVLYVHDGVRGVSNWKGSASAYNLSHACPLYNDPLASSVYMVYISLRDLVLRRCNPSKYMTMVKQDPMWNGERVNFTSLLHGGLWRVALRNLGYALRDCGVYLQGTPSCRVSRTIGYTSMHHVSLVPQILKELGLNYTVLCNSSSQKRVLDASFVRPSKPSIFEEHARERLEELAQTAAVDLTKRMMSPTETASRGYDTSLYMYERPNDGAFTAHLDIKYEATIRESGGTVEGGARLRSVLVKPTLNGTDCLVSRVELEDVTSGEITRLPVKTLHTSLGPSATELIVQDGDRASRTLLDKILLATGNTMIFLIKVDKAVLSPECLIKFRDNARCGLKHNILLGEREVLIDNKPYHFFALQGSTGALFPCKQAHPESPLNFLNCYLPKLLSLDAAGVEFDVVFTRNCSRGITAPNFITLSTPAANMAMVYGMGGYGMKTHVPNALLMKAVLRQRQLLSEGLLTEPEFRRVLKNSDFDKIPHWRAGNPFNRDYYQFLDKNYKTPVKFLFGKGRLGSVARLLRFLKR